VRSLQLLSVAVVIGVWIPVAQGQLVTYTINPAQSSLGAGGDLAGSNTSPQTAGSNSTSFFGTILAERIGNTIRFLDGSDIRANNQATNQQPASGGTPGSAPANYGLQSTTQFGTARAAVRDLRLDLSSNAINIVGINFPNDFTTHIDDGVIDFNTGLQFGDADLFGRFSGNSAVTQSTATLDGVNETLRLQFNIDFPYSALTTNDSNLNLVGTIIATGVIPEPAALSLVGVSLLMLRRRS
jgi:hypothetical protein